MQSINFLTKKAEMSIYMWFIWLIVILLIFLGVVATYKTQREIGIKVIVNGYEDCCGVEEHYYCGVTLKECNSNKEYSCVTNLIREGECTLQ